MDKVDPKFFEHLAELYIDFKKLNKKDKKLIIEYSKYIDSVLNKTN
jgi:hypothetical protein